MGCFSNSTRFASARTSKPFGLVAGNLNELLDAIGVGEQARPAFRVGDQANELSRPRVGVAEQQNSLLHVVLGLELHLADLRDAGGKSGERRHRIGRPVVSRGNWKPHYIGHIGHIDAIPSLANS